MRRLCIFLIIGLVGGCSGGRDSDAPVMAPESVRPGVYAGVFPCDGCPGIASTLWLRQDGRFFFRQRYPAADMGELSDVYSFGRWLPITDEAAIELAGAGPRRIFDFADQDALLMRTSSDLEYRLIRESTMTDFTATFRMSGVMRMTGDAASFTECLTGYVVPVSQRGDYARFRHQYRSAAGRGEPAFVELDGRFAWTADGAPELMTIEQFVRVKTSGTCFGT